MSAENNIDYGVLMSFLRSNEFLLEGILFCGLLIVLFVFFERKNRAEIYHRSVPRIKLRPCNPYGHLTYLASKKIMELLGLPTTTFVLQNLQGHGIIFQKEGLFCFEVAYANNVVLIKSEFAEELLNNSVFLEKGYLYGLIHPWVGTGLLTSYGSKWKSRRKLLTHSFHFDILKEFLPIFDEQSRILVDVLKHKAHEEWVDIVHLITLCSLDIICETTLGAHVGAQRDSDSDYVQAVLSASQIIMERVTIPMLHSDIIFQLSSLGRQFKKDLECLHNFTRKVIQQKKDVLKSNQVHSDDTDSGQNAKRKRKALMDLLLDVHLNNQEFTEEDVREEIDTFAFEGHDTTSMGMSWALYLIGLYPEVQNNIHKELDAIFGWDVERPVTVEDLKEMLYLERVLKKKFLHETNHHFPVEYIFGLMRFNQGENILESIFRTGKGGYHIKKGSTIMVNTFILHRNPEVFPNPEKFDPNRFLPENSVGRSPFAFVPFSAGPRNCIGQRFAVMEEKTVISNILRSFHVKSLEHRDKVFPASELILRSALPLKLKFTQRN